MKKIILSSMVLCFMAGACTKNNYQVGEHLTPLQQDEMMWKIIRYLGRPPEGLTFEERFYAPYDSVYREQAKAHKFDAYFIKGRTHYFLVSRKAPSVVDKRVATAGKFAVSGDEKIIEYEEAFRTWKMVPDTLAKREMILFDRFVKGESLEPYETKNSNGVEYIEFPDERTYFDKGAKMWRTK